MKILIIWLTISGFYLEDTFNDPTGTYELDSETTKYKGDIYGYYGEINVKLLNKKKIILTYYLNKGAPSYNSGSFFDTLEIQNSIAIYKNDVDIGCKLIFNFEKDGIKVIKEIDKNNGLCSDFGQGVNANGYFKKVSSEVPILKDPLTDESLDSVVDNVLVDSNEINKFITDGFVLLDSATGDLNLDGINDLILVLKNNDEENLRNEEFKNFDRPLLILIRDSTNTLIIARKNNNAVYSNLSGGMMGDSFVGVSIKNGYFSLEHYGGSAWRWSRSITFKYSKKENDWYLHTDVSTSFNANDLDSEDNYKEIIKTDKDFGKVKFEKFDIYIED